MDKSKIEWTDATWNPIRGCSKVSTGCANCYAERVASRFNGPGMPYEGTTENGRWNGHVKVVDAVMDQPLRWRRPRRVFVNSMSDLFHEKLEFETIAQIFAVMCAAKQHTFQVLTKRPGRMLEFFDWMSSPNMGGCLTPQRKMTLAINHKMGGRAPGGRLTEESSWPLPNVWLGVSVEDQKTADERIELLLQTPAAIRWISAEPLVGPISLRWGKWHPWKNTPGSVNNEYDSAKDLNWVVTGGESGPGARPADPKWYQELRDQCTAAGVPFFFKQWGEWSPVPAKQSFQGALYSVTTGCARIGKAAAGRILDGRTWDEYP
jgi:protein gp37